MNHQIEKIQASIAPLRQQIIDHKVYKAIEDLEDLRIFMQYHVYAVWDFMSLLKSLQQQLTCTTIPWFPKGDADTRFLINEIVVGEESDIDSAGVRKSHFEMYLDAMEQCGADTAPVLSFMEHLQKTGDLKEAFKISKTPKAARKFVNYTFKVIQSNKAHLQSATFTFGREDLIPDMFMSLVNDIDKHFPDKVSTLKYYLERHIEVDGGHHSHLALQMTSNLCGTEADIWAEAEKATLKSLQKRIALWDGAYNEIMDRKDEVTLNIIRSVFQY